MKILHITNNYPTERHPFFGIFVKEQIESLKKENISCDIFFINGREKGKKIYLLDLKKLFFYLIRNKYDIIHCHHVFSGVIYVLTGHAFWKKSILSYQNPPEFEGGKILFYFLYFFFNKIILKCKPIEIKRSKTIYLPNGVNMDFFYVRDKDECKKKLNLNVDCKYILFTDSYKKRKQKRIDRFNEMINYLKNNLKIQNIEPLVLTNTPREMMPLFINATDVHVITSDFEGSPNSVKECLACNVPVVSTNVGNVKEMIRDIEGCFVSDSFEPSDLAILVKQSLSTQNFDGRTVIKNKNYAIEDTTKELINIYVNILNDKLWKKN
ncbi:MAG: glycosyltransferase family 4 protein [Melioribacter sp.]|nr:glycosyltransferase family 4 protein [Melioribacter sp.]